MAKGAEAFRSIGEVASLIGVAPHVLRYWETQFAALKPMKRPDGRRYYRPADIELAAGICVLLREDGMTIRGAIRQIAADRGATVRQRGTAHLATRFGKSARPAPTKLTSTQPAPAREPEPEPLEGDAVWLARLSALARHLQRLQPGDARWSSLRAPVLGLAQAMLRLP